MKKKGVSLETEQSVRVEKPVIGIDEIREATEKLKKYKEGKINLEKRIVENEQWWKLRHWELLRKDKESDDEPTSAWLFNSIANKHADAMDNYPEPNILARTRDDEAAAAMLSKILPTLLEYNGYEDTYSNVWWYKLKQGTGVKGVFWNPDKENGLGDIDIKKIDILNLFWEPGIDDIQESSNMFHVTLVSNDKIKSMYPEIEVGAMPTLDIAKYVYDDNIDTSDKTIIVDWYYKKNVDGKTVLHYVKFAGDKVLYASENEEEYRDKGYYDHGMYPFVFDTLFVEEGTPCGFGYIDIMKSPESYIDRLNKCIMNNALGACKRRYIVSDQMGINEKDLTDLEKTVIRTPSNNLGENAFRELTTSPMSGIYINVLQNKIEELKETSGNRDFSQGGTSNGVTAASAISALMEAGSKLSRDMIGSSYRAFIKECYLVMELMRQFYTAPRCFRITGKGVAYEYEYFDNTMIKPQEQTSDFGVEYGERIPIFDIKVSASKKATYSRMSQNELAIQLYGLGIFNPELADQALGLLDIMDFDGKEKIIEKIKNNGNMYQKMEQMQQQILQMSQIIEEMSGMAIPEQMTQYPDMATPDVIVSRAGISQADMAAAKARSAASVR